MGDVVDHPLGHQVVRQFRQTPGGKRQIVIDGAGQGDLRDLCPLVSSEFPRSAAGVNPELLYEDMASGKKQDRPQLASCLKALRAGDTLVVWKLDRLGRDLRHLVNVVHDLNTRDVGLRVLAGQGASIDTTTAQGKLVFGIFAALAEFERELISERTQAGLESARARGRKGGRPFKMTPAKVRLAMASMGQPETSVAALCKELDITRQTLYRHVSPTGELREDGRKLLAGRQSG